MRYRRSWSVPAPLVPGEVEAIRVQLFPTSNRFARGHRIRVDVSSSNFPKYDINPNTGEPEARATHQRVAHNTVHLGHAQPSYIVLPLVPDTAQ